MRYSTTTMVVAALSVGQTLAGPTHAHLHRHRNVHEKKDVDWDKLDWAHMGIDWSSAWAAGQHSSTAPPAAAASTPAASPIIAAEVKPTAAAAPASSSSDSDDLVSSLTSDASSLFNGLTGLANSRVSFGQPAIGGGSIIGAIGNIGKPQGSNMVKVDSAEGYDFTNTFINTSPETMTVVIWNKAFSSAEDGGVEAALANLGSCVAPKTPALSFALAPKAKQVVAFQDETIIGWSQAVNAKTASGAFAVTWGEAKFNSGGSGYDMSAILNPQGNNYNLAISSSETPCVSDTTQNYWYATDSKGENPIPVGNSDGSCYIPGSKANLVTKMGGYL